MARTADSPPRGTRSRSAELAREEELRRIERMTPRERILLALRLGRSARLLATRVSSDRG